jgi:SAM-dependent methyltransferase
VHEAPITGEGVATETSGAAVPRALSRTWEQLGKTDPLWAVLSHRDRKRDGGTPWRVDEFMATGRAEVDAVVAYARALHPDLRTQRALDFGCGVGRLTQALARHFTRVDAVDISAPMLAMAEQLNAHGERCSYRRNTRQDLQLFATDAFDFVYSAITLQHMTPRVTRRYLGELARVTAPGGLLVFQLPAGLRRGWAARSNAAARLLGRARTWCNRRVWLLWQRTLRRRAVMDMFGIPRAEVARLLRARGLEVLDVVENDQAGPDWTSCRYCARKPAR